jgi:hypothetical protein
VHQRRRQENHGHAAIADRQGFIRRKQPASSLVQKRDSQPIPRPNVIHIDHAGRLRHSTSIGPVDLRPYPVIGHQT